MLTMIRNIILGIGWPVLIAGSIYIFLRGRKVYKLVKGSLVGKITKVLVYTMLVEMYSLGIVCTAYMFTDQKGVYLVIPIFGIWFVFFVWAIKAIKWTQKEASKLTNPTDSEK